MLFMKRTTSLKKNHGESLFSFNNRIQGNRCKVKIFIGIMIFIVILLDLSLSETHTSTTSSVKRRKKFHKDSKNLKKQDGALKLVGGNGDNQGNVEILHEGKWGSICDDEWDHSEATVVCKQLGYDSAIKATINGQFGQARRRFWMDDVYCDGTEVELTKCRFPGWTKNDCDSKEAAGVICEHEDKNSSSLRSTKKQKKLQIKNVHPQGMGIRLSGGRFPNEGRVEVKFSNSDWTVICGDGWSLLEAAVVCRQLGLGFASNAIQTNLIGDKKMRMSISGIQCYGNEINLNDCRQDNVTDCPGKPENVASVKCSRDMPDLIIDGIELSKTAYLEDRQLYWLQCAMEENCVSSKAYKILRETENWREQSRRLLRFTARILNAGTADFRSSVPKHLWEWHMCHKHYHSMEIFATFDIIDSRGNKVAEGHKASFCLEDNQCLPGIEPRYKCANYGDQGISVNCSDIYKHSIDCQWVDITELEPGEYTFKVSVNPEFKVAEMSYDNNAAICRLKYTSSYATVYDCVMGRP